MEIANITSGGGQPAAAGGPQAAGSPKASRGPEKAGTKAPEMKQINLNQTRNKFMIGKQNQNGNGNASQIKPINGEDKSAVEIKMINGNGQGTQGVDLKA